MKNLISESNKIIRWPKKSSEKVFIIEYLATKFSCNYKYSEREVNAIINRYHLFEDTTLLRRELISRKYLKRKDDGSEYWKID